MGAGVLDALANNPLRAEAQSNQNAMTQAQLPGVQAQSQIAQRQALDQQVFSDAFRNAGGDWTKTMTGIMQDPRGISPQGYIGMQNDHIQMQRNMASLSKDQYEAMKPMLDEHGQLLQTVLDAGPEGTPQRQQQAKVVASQLGMPDPTSLFTDNGIKTALAVNNRLDQSLTNAKTSQETKTSAAQAGEATQKTAAALRQQGLAALSGVTDQASQDQWAQKYPSLAREIPSMYSPAAVQYKQRELVPVPDQPKYDIEKQFQQNSNPQSRHAAVDAITSDPQTRQTGYGLVDNAPNLEAYQDALKQIGEAQKQVNFETNPQVQQGKEQVAAVEGRTRAQAEIAARQSEAMNTPGDASQHGDAYLQTLPPALQAQVKAISEGRATMPPMGTRGAGATIRNAAFQYDPSYSDQRAQIRKAFTTGADGKNIGALNTASVHLDQLSDAADALKNGSFQPGNSAYNYFATMFGGAPPTNFNSLKAAVSGELASALKGNATDQEIHTIAGNISSAQSPDQLKGAIDTNLHILGAKLGTYQQRYQQQIPGDTNWSPVLPQAKQVLQKHGIDVSNPQASGGNAGPAGGLQPGQQVKLRNGKTVTVGVVHPDGSFDPK